MKKNLLYQTLYQLLATALPLITTPYASRVLGVYNLGIYSYVATIANYFVVFAMLGFTNYGSKAIASSKNNSNQLQNTYYGIHKLQCISASIMLIAYIGFIFLFVDENQSLYIIEGLWVVNCFIDINWFYFGLEEFKLTVTRNLIIKLITVIGLFFLVHSKNDLLMYAFILVIGTVLSDLYLMTQVKKRIPIKSKISFRNAFRHLRPTILLFVPILAMTLYNQMNKTMLGLLSTYDEVGYYGNADKIINILFGLITGLGTVSLPKMMTLISEGKTEEYKDIVNKSVTLVLVCCSAISFGILAIAKEFVPVFFGKGYEPCIILTSVLSFIIYFKAISVIVVNQILIPNNREKSYIAAVFIGAAINFIFNNVLIRLYGAMGAAVSTIIAEAVVCGSELYMVRNNIPILKFIRKNLIYIFWGLIMCVGVKLFSQYSFINNTIIKLAIEIMIGGLIYTVCCVLYWKITSNPIYDYFLEIIFKRIKK